MITFAKLSLCKKHETFWSPQLKNPLKYTVCGFKKTTSSSWGAKVLWRLLNTKMHNLTDLFLESKGAGDWETHLTNYLKIHGWPPHTVPDVSATGLYQRNCASSHVMGTSDSFHIHFQMHTMYSRLWPLPSNAARCRWRRCQLLHSSLGSWIALGCDSSWMTFHPVPLSSYHETLSIFCEQIWGPV